MIGEYKMEKIVADIDKAVSDEMEVQLQEVNILHISDLHFGVGKTTSKKELYREQRREMIDSLISQLCSYKDSIGHWKPDVVVVSGDLAFRGKSLEYTQYKEDFYNTIKDGFGLDDDCIVVCPGNHDVIRKNTITGKTASGKDILYPRPENKGDSIGNELKGLRKLDEDSLCRELIGDSIKKPLAKHFHDYIEVCCEGDPQKLVRLQIPKKWPWVHFAVLNSAWDCRDDQDEGKLRVGLDFLKEILQQSKSVGPEDSVICALFHHPHIEIDIDDGKGGRKTCNWLTSSEQHPFNRGDDCFVNRLNNSVKCIMNGHVHEEKTPTYLGNDAQTGFWSICGTLLSNDTSTYHCRVIKIRRGGSLSYIDLSNTSGDTSGDWKISFHPGNRVDRELLKRESLVKEKMSMIQNTSRETLLSSNETLELFAWFASHVVAATVSNSELIDFLFEHFLKETILHKNNDVYTLRRRRKEQ